LGKDGKFFPIIREIGNDDRKLMMVKLPTTIETTLSSNPNKIGAFGNSS